MDYCARAGGTAVALAVAQEAHNARHPKRPLRPPPRQAAIHFHPASPRLPLQRLRGRGVGRPCPGSPPPGLPRDLRLRGPDPRRVRRPLVAPPGRGRPHGRGRRLAAGHAAGGGAPPARGGLRGAAGAAAGARPRPPGGLPATAAQEECLKMESSQQHMVAFLRMVHARAGGTGAILNLIRASEVRGGADIIALTDLVSDPQLKMDLAKHAMDEARHSYLLLRRMTQLGFAAYRLPPELDRLESLFERSRARDVKQVYTDRGSIDDAELMEIMMVAYIPENDAAAKLQANYEALSADPDSQAVITSILRDEERHIEYLG